MSIEIRDLTADDGRAATQLGHEAFGGPAPKPEEEVAVPEQPAIRLGVFDGGELVARAIGLEHQLWFGGRPVPSLGIGGVTVRAEDRGRGLLAPLLTELLRRGREQGAVVSSLYASAHGIYRRFGYELIGDMVSAQVPTTQLLPRQRVPADVTVRRVREADLSAVHEVYSSWARAHNGALTRTGPVFAEPWGKGASAALLAVRGDTVIGCCRQVRGEGNGAEVVQEVEDLIATEEAGLAALLTVLAGNHSVTGLTSIETSGLDPVRQLIPGAAWKVTSTHAYGLAVLDPAAALAARGWPAMTAAVDLAVEGRGFRIELDGAGGAAVTSIEVTGLPDFTARGFAVAHAGAQPCAMLRSIGLLTGDARSDSVLDALFAGQVGVRDAF